MIHFSQISSPISIGLRSYNVKNQVTKDIPPEMFISRVSQFFIPDEMGKEKRGNLIGIEGVRGPATAQRLCNW